MQPRARLAAAAGFAATIVLALVALGAGSPGRGWRNVWPSAAEYQYRPAARQYGRDEVTLCHDGRTIAVVPSAVPAHLRDDDTFGPC